MRGTASISSAGCCCPRRKRAFRSYRRPVRFLAMRFAAKEAIVKALGTGFAHGMWIRDVGISAERVGSARGDLVGPRPRRRDELGAGEGHVTLTDEAGLVSRSRC